MPHAKHNDEPANCDGATAGGTHRGAVNAPAEVIALVMLDAEVWRRPHPTQALAQCALRAALQQRVNELARHAAPLPSAPCSQPFLTTARRA